MTMEVNATSPGIPLCRAPGRSKRWAGLLTAIRRLLSRPRSAPSIHHLNDRDLADLNLRRWQIEDPDPRAPRLF